MLGCACTVSLFHVLFYSTANPHITPGYPFKRKEDTACKTFFPSAVSISGRHGEQEFHQDYSRRYEEEFMGQMIASHLLPGVMHLSSQMLLEC